jgi:hypothetical protein
VNWLWVGSIGGMLLRGENRSTQRRTCPIAGLSTINFTYSGLGSNAVFCHENPFSSCRVLFSVKTSKLIGAFLNLTMRKCQKRAENIVQNWNWDWEIHNVVKNGLEVVTKLSRALRSGLLIKYLQRHTSNTLYVYLFYCRVLFACGRQFWMLQINEAYNDLI